MADTLNAELFALLKESMDINREFLNETLSHELKMNVHFTNYYRDMIEMNKKALEDWKKIEPPKILKSIHSEWQERVNKINNDIAEASAKYEQQKLALEETQKIIREHDA